MRHFRKGGLVGLIAVLGIGLIAASFGGRKPLLIWNFTASAPLGLYMTLDRPWTNGDWVAVRPPLELAELLRHYKVIEPGRVMIKRVAASSGDIACRRGVVVTIDGVYVARALNSAAGRSLPLWLGWQRLDADQVFLMGSSERSFDGRYFGITRSTTILAPLRKAFNGDEN